MHLQQIWFFQRHFYKFLLFQWHVMVNKNWNSSYFSVKYFQLSLSYLLLSVHRQPLPIFPSWSCYVVSLRSCGISFLFFQTQFAITISLLSKVLFCLIVWHTNVYLIVATFYTSSISHYLLFIWFNYYFSCQGKKCVAFTVPLLFALLILQPHYS